MKKYTEKLKEKFIEGGADIVKIAPIERFSDVAPENHPSSIFPEAKTVIVAGFFIPRGTLRGIEEGTYFHNYDVTNGGLDLWLPWFFHNVVDVLESGGWEGVPIFPHVPEAIINQGVQVAPDRPAANVGVDVELAAVRAGMGEIGFNGLFLTPEFGPLEKLIAVITDAPLEADPVLKKAICDKCMACVKKCPLSAISENNTRNINAAGKIMKTGIINRTKCDRCQNGAVKSRFPDTPVDRIPALCSRECLINLEEKNILTQKWPTKFRKRDSWSVVDGEAVKDLEEQKTAARLG